MTHQQWLNSISKDDLAFRLYGKDYHKRTCLECVFYKADRYGSYKCTAEDYVSDECERQYMEWLEEEMA